MGRQDSVRTRHYVAAQTMELEESAADFVNAISRLLAEGGFRLHKWMSTSRKVIMSINPTERAGSVKEISGDTDLPSDRALGMNWDVERDSFFYIDIMRKAVDQAVTRRSMLSTTTSLFDLLGI